MRFHPFNHKRAGDFWTHREPATVSPESLDAVPVSHTTQFSEPATVSPLSLLEAALFLAQVPFSSRKLAQLAGLPEGTRTRQLIRELNKRYDKDQSAFCIAEVAEGFQLRTRPEFAPWLVRMQGVPTTVRLSNPAVETLTVIAYRQPIPRTEVERIRGVQCGDLIRQLLDQDLAKIVGRSEDLGRPFLYGTTPKFLQVFGLGSLNDLPVLEN
jgi:segregation and condensation protein B